MTVMCDYRYKRGLFNKKLCLTALFDSLPAGGSATSKIACLAGGFVGALSGAAAKTSGEAARGMDRKKLPLSAPRLVFAAPPPSFSSSTPAAQATS